MNSIVIKSGTSTQRAIKGKDGTQYLFNEQTAAIEKGEDFPVPFRIRLGDGQPPYPPGHYLVDSSSFEVGQYGDLKIGRRVMLVPVAPADKAK